MKPVIIGPEQAVVLRILTPKIRDAMAAASISGDPVEAWKLLVAAAEAEPRPAPIRLTGLNE